MGAVEHHRAGDAPPSGEFVEGPQPGEPEGGDDPPLVDLVGARPPDRAVERPLAHGRGQGLPPLGGERLGVGQAGGRVGGARGCEGDADCDGAGQGAAAHLVDAGDDAELVGQGLLEERRGAGGAHWGSGTTANTSLCPMSVVHLLTGQMIAQTVPTTDFCGTKGDCPSPMW